MSSTPYFTSRQRSNYTRPGPHTQAAANGNKNELRRSLLTLGARIGQLETRAGGSSINLKSSSPVSTPPPQAGVVASAGSGVFRIQITNPQFKVQNKGNLPNTPIVHRIRFSPTADFASPTELPITNQTIVETSQFGSSRKWIEVSNSYDGINFNPPVRSGPHQS